jgi:hypothetical protein
MKEEKLEKEKPETELVNLSQRKRKAPSKPLLPTSNKVCQIHIVNKKYINCIFFDTLQMLKFAPTVELFEPINCWWEKELNKNGQQVMYNTFLQFKFYHCICTLCNPLSGLI